MSYRNISSSFMIIDHPKNGANPVLIYERIGPGTYRAEGSVKIISLLHGFMQNHPHLIQLFDIGKTTNLSSFLIQNNFFL